MVRSTSWYTTFENAPDSDCVADLAAASVDASIRSADRFGLGQVELVVQEGAAREFARLRQAQAGLGPGFEHAREQHAQHDRAAVTLQFQHVLAGVRVRSLEVQGQAFVDDGAVRILEQ